MLKLIIFLIAGYFILKIIKTMLAPKKDSSKVKGKAQKEEKKPINKKHIEDADYEEIE